MTTFTIELDDSLAMWLKCRHSLRNDKQFKAYLQALVETMILFTLIPPETMTKYMQIKQGEIR